MNASFLASKSLAWQQLQPQLDLPSAELHPLSFLDLQPRATKAIKAFLQNPQRKLLVLKADDQSEFAPLVEQFVQQQAGELTLRGANYVIEQGDSFSFPRVTVEPAQSFADNFCAKATAVAALLPDAFQLFGSLRVHPSSQDIQLTAGLVHQLNGGVLIVSAGAMLSRFDLWQRLKQIALSGQFDWYSAHPHKDLPCEIPSYPVDLKVIVLGNRSELAALQDVEEHLYHLADYAELESYIETVTLSQKQNWAAYVQGLCAQLQLAPLNLEELNALYQLLVRESENRTLINSSPLVLKPLLMEAALLAQDSSQPEDKRAGRFKKVFYKQRAQYGFLREQAYQDILHEQVYVDTDGEMVGQINGLSVIEFPGTPLSFGEPSRISCLVQFGDGEVVDVERKNELAGNIHSKGMMIAQTCLANILEFPSQLPFSASLVFEQSYGEIDGDSASLASFCVLTSALSDLPLPQSIAVTGAIDQFGLVHSVGGINDKIEGFFEICQRRQLTGKQGVIIPSTVLNQLSLSDEVVEAVKNQQFFIMPVENVEQACQVLFQRDLFDQGDLELDKENQPLSRVINRRLAQYAENQTQRGGFWNIFARKN